MIVKLFFGEQKEVAERLENVTLRLENHLPHHEVPSRYLETMLGIPSFRGGKLCRDVRRNVLKRGRRPDVLTFREEGGPMF